MTGSQNDAKLRQILIEAIFRKKRLFLLVLFEVVLATILIILIMPRKYESDAKLIVENLRTRSALSTQPVDKVVMSDDVSETQINSEVELLQSQAVLRKALNMPAVTPESDVRGMTREQTELKALQNKLTVDPVRQSSIINVKLAASTAGGAVRTLNGILNAYFEVRATLTRSVGAAEFFERQSKSLGEQLDKSSKELSDFEIAHNVADLNDQKKLQEQRLASLDDQISQNKALLANQDARSRNLVRQLSATPARSETTVRSVTNQYSQEHLNTALVDLENRRAELLHRYQPTDRAVLELNEKIAITQKAIQQAGSSPATEKATDMNPVYQQISALLVSSSAEISGASAQESDLLQQRQAAQARLHELLEVTGTYDDLNRRFQEEQTNYNLYVEKRDQARVSEALDSEKMFDVSLVQRPVSSMVPVRPKPIPYFLAGLFLAFCMACAVALYADISGARIYSPQQLDSVTQMQTIATIPQEMAEPRAAQVGDDNVVEYRRLLYAVRTELGHPPGEPNGDGLGHCVAFTSAVIGEGVSYIVGNLAAEAASHVTQRVAILNMQALLEKTTAGQSVPISLARNPATSIWSLAGAGGAVAPNAGEQGANYDEARLGELRSDRLWSSLNAILVRARQEFSFVLIDCPSFRRSTLAMEMDRYIDGYIVVVGAGMVRKHQLEQAATLLRQTSTPVLGYVLNRRTYPVPPWLYRIFW